MINLAREIGADELLPSAFYELSRYTFTQIYEPALGEPLDSTPAIAAPAPTSSSASASSSCVSLHPPPAPAHVLSPADMQRLALGKEAATQAVTALIQSMEHASDLTLHRRTRSNPLGPLGLAPFPHPHPHPHPNPAHPHAHPMHAPAFPPPPSAPSPLARLAPCSTPAACRRDLTELAALAAQHYLIERARGCADPLYVAEELGQLKSAEFADCAACARALEAWAARERERLWRAVPEWFRLRR